MSTTTTHKEHAEHHVELLIDHLEEMRKHSYVARKSLAGVSKSARFAWDALRSIRDNQEWTALGYESLDEMLSSLLPDTYEDAREADKILRTAIEYAQQDANINSIAETLGYLPGMAPPLPKTHATALRKLSHEEQREVYASTPNPTAAKLVEQIFKRLPPEKQKEIIAQRQKEELAKAALSEEDRLAKKRKAAVGKAKKALAYLRKDCEQHGGESVLEFLQQAEWNLIQYEAESLFASGS